MSTKKKPDTKNEDINKLFLQEIGLDVTKDGHIIDQDTFNTIQIKKTDTVLKGFGEINKGSIELDPAKNSKHAKILFDYYINKLADNDEIEAFSSYNSYITDEEKAKGIIECKTSDNEVMKSGEYVNESLRYLDTIMQLNGDPTPDISKYDRTKEEFDKIRRAEDRARKAEIKKRMEARKPKYEPGSEEQRQAQLRAIRRNIAAKKGK